MQNNFEREVRQKMDELRMQPSVPVWEKVQLEIEPERRKRRGIFWLLLIAGVLFGGLGIYMVLGKQEVPAAQLQSKTETTSAKEQKKNAVEMPKVDRQASSTTSKKFIEVTVSQSKRTSVLAASKSIQPVQSVAKKSSLNSSVSEETLLVDKAHRASSTNINTVPGQQDILVRTSSSKLSPALVFPSVNIPTDALSPQPQLTTVTAAIKVLDSLQKGKDSSAKLVRNTKAGWRKMATVSIGYSSYSSGLFSLLGVEKAMAADVRNPLYAGVGNSQGGAYVPQRTATSSVLPALSVSAAGFIEKSISRRTELMIGLSYHYYRTRQPLGIINQVDTTVSYSGSRIALNSYYTAGDSSRYTNHIHAVSLPIGINWQVHKRLPLFASITAAYGRVVAVDAIAYSASSNLFFEKDTDEDYLKHQLPLSVGLAYRFRIGAAQSLAVGPTATYQLLRLNTPATNNAQHLSFVGIQTSLRF